jgi:hypothetical protein
VKLESTASESETDHDETDGDKENDPAQKVIKGMDMDIISRVT